MPRFKISVTARHASLTLLKIASAVLTPSGVGVRRTKIRVAMPNVPSEPTKAETKS
jgi:hypothetical protein